ncbi:MAG: hypothetical protein V4648_09415 [Bacteroidota bacterium]
MTATIYNRNNFHKYTFCIFKEVDVVAIESLMLHYKSKSGSCYYFVEEGVYRLSNHWGRAANCRWRLASEEKTKPRTKLGFAKWTEFYPDNEVDKLYFMVADFDTQSVQFYHKESENYTSAVILRTANETMKRIKQIRLLFEETAWTKYLKEENVAVLRKEIIQKLVDSNSSFQEIRSQYL